jgi:hypothetical protein
MMMTVEEISWVLRAAKIVLEMMAKDHSVEGHEATVALLNETGRRPVELIHAIQEMQAVLKCQGHPSFAHTSIRFDLHRRRPC